ncbi:SDR family NAD(P)-dependent oxidoreductase [Streptomyces sp. NPDC002764]|uniref:SDR family NAD(P)-dependent oxidoreductase n=1 Tax=Streptomyces sp. NPDC002764 TaxID=3154428 RepID=UPI0033332CA9
MRLGERIGLSEPLAFTNGLLPIDEGRTMLVAETPAMRLVALPVLADGRLGPPRPWAPLIEPWLWKAVTDPGLVGSITRRISALLDHQAIADRSSSPIAPDGIAPGKGGTAWVANALRGECVRVGPGGTIMDRVSTSQRTLSCLVAGPKGDTLYAATVPTDDPPRSGAQRFPDRGVRTPLLTTAPRTPPPASPSPTSRDARRTFENRNIMARITDRTILIVGASSGMGAEVARQLAPGKNRLVITARRAPELARIAEQVRAAGSSCLDIAADALDPRRAADVVAAAAGEFGSVDIALLNAGAGPDMAMDQLSVADVSRITALNYDVVVNYLIPLTEQMLRQPDGGLIAHTNSLAGLMGIPRQGPYSAAKAAARTLLDAARVELEPRGIRFTNIFPGFVATQRISEDGLPKPFEISEERGARHVVRALEREPAQAYFPWPTAALVRTLRALPTPLASLILRQLAYR